MDCSECNFRSAVGYCIACQRMLCEECGIICDGCGKLVCSDHAYETRHHRRLCPPCQEERKARRAERKEQGKHKGSDRMDAAVAAGGTSFQDLAAEPIPAPIVDGEPVDVSNEVLTASGHKKWQPWQLSLIASVLGLAGAVAIMLVPSIRGLKLRSGGYVPMPYILVFLPLISFFWAFMGLTYAKFWEDREKCLVSAGMGVLCIILLFAGVFTDPVRRMEKTETVQRTRDDMDQEELTEWRRGILSKYE